MMEEASDRNQQIENMLREAFVKSTPEAPPAALEQAIFTTLDTIELFGKITDLFTMKMARTGITTATEIIHTEPNTSK